MSGDFRKFPELHEYDVLASPNPGDCLSYREASVPSADLWTIQHPITNCCMPRLVRLTDDRSAFTRESFGGI